MLFTDLEASINLNTKKFKDLDMVSMAVVSISLNTSKQLRLSLTQFNNSSLWKKIDKVLLRPVWVMYTKKRGRCMGKETKILESKNNIEKSIRKNRILQTIVMVSNPSRIGTVLVSLSSMVNRNGVVRVSLNINLSNPTVIMVHKVNTNQDNNLSSLVLNKVNTNQDNNLDFPSNLPLSKVNTLRDSNRDSNMANNMDSLSNHTIKINNTNMDRANRSINMNTIIVIIMKNNTSLSFQSINKKVNMVEINKKVV